MPFSAMYSWVRLLVRITKNQINVSIPGREQPLITYDCKIGIRSARYLHFASENNGYMLVLEHINNFVWLCPHGFIADIKNNQTKLSLPVQGYIPNARKQDYGKSGTRFIIDQQKDVFYPAKPLTKQRKITL